MGVKMNTTIYKDTEEKKEQNLEQDSLSFKFLQTRQILLSGEVNKSLAEKVIRQLLLLESISNEPIRIFIDSPGGDVDAGYAIFDMIRFIKAPVYCIGMGLAADKTRRLGLPNSHYLIHQPLSGINGVATDIEIHAKELEKTRAKINDLIAQETGKPLAQVQLDTDRDYWLNAEEAKEYGLIDKVVSSRDQL